MPSDTIKIQFAVHGATSISDGVFLLLYLYLYMLGAAFAVYNMVVSKHQQEGVECGSIYVNGVIWPSATHGTTATKGEVVYCFWCTVVLVYH